MEDVTGDGLGLLDSVLLSIPTRRGNSCYTAPTRFMWGCRTTSVDVMAVTNTTCECVSAVREDRPTACHFPYEGNMLGFDGLRSHTALTKQRELQSRAKKSRDMHREQSGFIARLTKEREERIELERWGATRIQSVFRGYLVRPRPLRPRARITMAGQEGNRKLVAEIQSILSKAGLPLIPGTGLDGNPEGSEAARLAYLTKRWQKSRRFRAICTHAATKVQAIARGHSGRLRAQERQEEVLLARQHLGARKFQQAWCNYSYRKTWWDRAAGLKDEAAGKIQPIWRGVATRQHLAERRREERAMHRRDVACTIIGRRIRVRLARVKVKKLRAERSKAQAEAERIEQEAWEAQLKGSYEDRREVAAHNRAVIETQAQAPPKEAVAAGDSSEDACLQGKKLTEEPFQPKAPADGSSIEAIVVAPAEAAPACPEVALPLPPCQTFNFATLHPHSRPTPLTTTLTRRCLPCKPLPGS
ncbi:unnamed protein product [Chrysoparadoxa australica]